MTGPLDIIIPFFAGEYLVGAKSSFYVGVMFSGLCMGCSNRQWNCKKSDGKYQQFSAAGYLFFFN